MPIEAKTLEGIARTYVRAMTSIRGRRVLRLLMREFARFDQVLAATAEDGTPALFALAEDGSAAICRTDGRGDAAEIDTWACLANATVTTSYDLKKDSLPTVGWTIRHPGFASGTGALTIARADLSEADCDRIAEWFRRIGR
jgi:hypothetical protein